MVRFGSFELDVRAGELRKDSVRLKVPTQSIEILKALVERPGDLVTREELRERLWPSDTFVDFEHGLNAAVRRLREAVGDSADKPTFIETLPRRGYRFIALIDGAPPQIAARPLTAADSASRPPRRFPLLGLLVTALLAIGVGIGVWLTRQRFAPAAAQAALVPRETASLRNVPITSFPGREVDPAISPEGNHVAFAWDGDRGGNLDIHVKQIDGGTPIQLTSDVADDRAPAWSPDGKRIAFLRTHDDGPGMVVIVPAFGGPERRLEYTTTTAEPTWTTQGVSWTPDSKAVFFAARSKSSLGYAIFVASIDSNDRRQLTSPGDNFTDAVPRLSPDGRQLGFVRRLAGTWEGDVMVQPLDGLRPIGEARHLVDDARAASFDWFPDGRSVVYDRDRESLWRAMLDTGRREELLPGVRATRPSVGPGGAHLFYQRLMNDRNIWRMPGLIERGAKVSRAPDRIIASTFEDGEPQISRDGERIVFDSLRSGSNEIWVAQKDGRQPMQLTTDARCGCSPRWSPDGRWIAFDASKQSGVYNIYVVSSEGGAPRALTAETTSNNARASWSKDGRWIYFGSTRTGRYEIWKVPSDGGAAVQVTKHGGFEAFESPDGAALYYAREVNAHGIWRVPVSGGEEAQVVDHGIQGSFAVTDRGLFLANSDVNTATLEFTDFRSRRVSTVASFPPGTRLNVGGPTFSVSRDGHWVFYTNLDDLGSDIAMIEGLMTAVGTAPARVR